MHAVKLDIQSALQQAQTWLQYEGIIQIQVSCTPNGSALIVLTSCNPAAITAPVPSYFYGFPVTFRQSKL